MKKVIHAFAIVLFAAAAPIWGAQASDVMTDGTGSFQGTSDQSIATPTSGSAEDMVKLITEAGTVVGMAAAVFIPDIRGTIRFQSITAADIRGHTGITRLSSVLFIIGIGRT